MAPFDRIVVLLLAPTLTTCRFLRSSLHVDSPPDYVRPYVIEHNAPAKAVQVGSQTYRFPITNSSSGGRFTYLSAIAPSMTDLGVLPHQHYTHFENFYCFEGRMQLWADNKNTSVGRLMTAGDYGAVPTNTTHTYQLLDPLTELVAPIVPGGFEELFFAIADKNYSALTNTPYDPAPVANAAGGGSSPELIEALESFDVWSQLDFSPRRDFVNGSAPASGWHSTNDSLPNSSDMPYFIAKDYGTKYLHTSTRYEVIQPFVTPIQSGEYNFTYGSITLSAEFSNETTAVPGFRAPIILEDHMALHVVHGVLTVWIDGVIADTNYGDVVFIPGGTPFTYASLAYFTKVLYVGVGSETLDRKLISNATAWNSPVFPRNF